MMHEHSRSDRDRYIQVYPSRTQTGAWQQFAKSGPGVGTQVPYDILSLMHYSSRTFAKGRAENIQPKALGCRQYTNRGLAYCRTHYKLGQRVGLSQ